MQSGLIVTSKMPEIPIVRVVKADTNSLIAHWDMVRRELIRLKQKFALRCPHVPLNWVPEHFRYEILKNLAGGMSSSPIELFYALGKTKEDPNEEIQGFFITTVEMDSALHIPMDFLIWIARAWRPRVLEAALLQADDLAKMRGCTGIKHMSPFLAWGRRQRKMMERLREVYGDKAGQEWHMQYVIWRRSLVD